MLLTKGIGHTKFKQTKLGEIPEDWSIDEIQDHSKITTGNKNTQDRIEGGKYPFFVRSQKIERINTYSFDGEAVLTAGDGVGTGKVFHYINGKFDFHQRVYNISNFSDRMDGYFFYTYFSNYFLPRIQSMSAKTTIDSVRMDMIAKMLIPIPDIKEQRKIASILSIVDSQIQNRQEQRSKLETLKKGLMQKLLTGKIRVKI
jgi:type I restriction enzyme S subunit